MQKRWQRPDILFVLGYGLYKAAGSSGYLTALGAVGGSAGFVSVDAFMFAGTATAVLTCVAVALLGARLGRSFPIRWAAWGAYGLLVVDFILAALVASPLMTGMFYGLSSTVLSVVWFALCVQKTDCPAVSIASALLLSVAIQALMALFQVGGAITSVALLSLSSVCFEGIRSVSSTAEFRCDGARDVLPSSASGFTPSLLCLMVCVFVVSASNVTAVGSSLEPLFTDIDMQVTNMVGALVAAILVFCGSSLRHPAKAYTYLLPVLFAVFSLIPIFGGGLGSAAGAVMVGSYQAIAFLFAAFSVGVATQERLNPYGFSPLCFGGSNVALLLGMVVGAVVGMLGNKGLPVPALVMLVSIYPLGLVLLYVNRRRRNIAGGWDLRSRGDDSPSAALLEQMPPDSPENAGALFSVAAEDAEGTREERVGDVESALRRRVADLAQRYGLTKREEEILLYVARGRSARVIAEELYISESTVWSHIKKIYAKTERRSKQALLDLVERD